MCVTITKNKNKMSSSNSSNVAANTSSSQQEPKPGSALMTLLKRKKTALDRSKDAAVAKMGAAKKNIIADGAASIPALYKFNALGTFSTWRA